MIVKLINLLSLSLLTFATTVSAGGILPAGYGNTYSNHTYLPKTNDVVTWSAYGEPLVDPVLRDILGGCPLGLHTCLQWTVDGPYRLCSQARIRIWTANIAVGGPLYDRLPNILRHEWSHALGYSDNVGGPTDIGSKKFTECQLAQMESYSYSTDVSGWTVVNLPECE